MCVSPCASPMDATPALIAPTWMLKSPVLSSQDSSKLNLSPPLWAEPGCLMWMLYQQDLSGSILPHQMYIQWKPDTACNGNLWVNKGSLAVPSHFLCSLPYSGLMKDCTAPRMGCWLYLLSCFLLPSSFPNPHTTFMIYSSVKDCFFLMSCVAQRNSGNWTSALWILLNCLEITGYFQYHWWWARSYLLTAEDYKRQQGKLTGGRCGWGKPALFQEELNRTKGVSGTEWANKKCQPLVVGFISPSWGLSSLTKQRDIWRGRNHLMWFCQTPAIKLGKLECD